MTNSKKLNNSSEIGIEHRYIDVELLKEQFEKHCEQVGESVDDWGMFYDEFPRMLADIPSADVQPVVHAHLVPIRPEYEDHRTIGIGLVYCDNCGNTFAPAHERIKSIKYCPYCGAKMDGNEHD